jgi:hypothetical protein
VEHWLTEFIAQDCGSSLYADLPLSYGSYIDDLAMSLQGPGPEDTQPYQHFSDSEQGTRSIPSKMVDTPQLSVDSAVQSPRKSAKKSRDNRAPPIECQITDEGTPDGIVATQSFLAFCINTRGIYKVCSEIPISKLASDAQLFLEMKKRYISTRGYWSRFNFLVKHTTIEFIQVIKNRTRILIPLLATLPTIKKR